MPVNTRTGVPTRCRLSRIVSANRDHVGLVTEAEMLCQFVAKADITIRAFTKVESIYPDVAVSHHAVEVNKDSPVVEISGKTKMLSIPANARRQETAGSASRILFVEGPFNTPIMRYILLAPGAVVEVWLLGAGSIAFKKAPIAVEGRSNSSICHRLRKCSGDNRKHGHNHRKEEPVGRA